MPILPFEPSIFPDNLLETPVPVVQHEHSWWVLYTLPRREKELIRRLRQMEIPHYAPQIRRRTKPPRGRPRTVYVPLFPSYVFLCGSDEHRQQSLGTKCISRCLTVTDSERFIHDLRQIQRLIEADAPLTPESRLQPGMRVRIRSGSLAGLEGTVLKRRGKMRLLVAVEFLQRGASVLLDDFEVEEIQP